MYQVKKSGIPEFLKLAKTIRKWRKEILNYFRAFLTNGAVEEIINKIKLIKRVTCTLPNFEHLVPESLLNVDVLHNSPKIVKEPKSQPVKEPLTLANT